MTDDVSPATKSALSGTVLALLGLGLAAIVGLVVVLLFRTDDPRVEETVEAAEGAKGVTQTSLNPGWKPPAADAAPSVLVPQAFDGWNLETSDANARNAAFGLTRDGQHGRYTRVGAARGADLYIYPGEENDAAEIDRIRALLSDESKFGAVRFGEPELTPGAKTLRFDMAPRGDQDADAGVPESHGVLAAVPGWLLFARSEKEDDLVPFLAAYMRAVEADGAAEAPSTAAPGD